MNPGYISMGVNQKHLRICHQYRNLVYRLILLYCILHQYDVDFITFILNFLLAFPFPFCHLLIIIANNLGPKSGSEVIKLYSCSTQLSSKFQLLINTKILTNKEVSCFKSLRCCIYHANKC